MTTSEKKQLMATACGRSMKYGKIVMIVSDEPKPVTPWMSAPTNDTKTMIR